MTKNSEIRNYGKVCTISGNTYPGNLENFYVNNNSDDGLHPYHKYFDNVRRSTGVSVGKLREIINFQTQ